MPIILNGMGETDAFIHQSGSKIPCKAWEKTSGGKRLIYSPVQIIDDFEDGDRSGWNVPGSSGSDTIVSGMNGTQYAWQLNGPREGHLSNSNAVDRGPQPGDTFEFRFRVTDFSGGPSIFRFDFACAGTNDGDVYRLEWEGSNTSGADMSLEKYAGGSPPPSGDPNVSTASVSPSVGDDVYIKVGWNESGDGIYANYSENGSYQATVSISDTEYSQPGVRVQANGYIDVIVDEIRIPS